MGRRVVSKRIVAGRGMKMKARRSAMKARSGGDQNRTALYAIIAIVAIVVIVIIMRGRANAQSANMGGQATVPAGYQGCRPYWSAYCAQQECTRATQACADYCTQRTHARCDSSTI